MDTEKKNIYFVYIICFIVSLGGLMFGFDLGIITGIIPYIEKQFSLSGFNLGWVVAVFELGAMVGAFTIIKLADLVGRKKTMLFCSFFLIVTAFGVAFASTAIYLSIFRFIQGYFVGAVSILSPMYIAEIAPKNMRGRLVSINQLTIIMGIFFASCSNYYLGVNNLDSNCWRYMFLSAAIPALIFFLLLFIIPESPRWLIIFGKDISRAKLVLQRTQPIKTKIEDEMKEIEKSVQEKTSFNLSYKKILSKTYLPILLVGICIAFLQQLCGINNVTPYMQKIFLMAGIKLEDGLFNAIFVQLVFFLSTIIAILLIDRMGRRLLMLMGTALMAVSLLILSIVFNNPQSGIFIFIIIMIYIGSFGFTLGPVVWVLISEMFPPEIRGKAMGISSASLWLATFFVVLISPSLLKIGASFNFIIFSILNVFGFLFCLKFLPETKGKTLEEMDEVWRKKPQK
ncbi:MAG: sugar porter family MFS transporter [Bacteroidales bacterium]|nr:sugar porter family MFS transporter [Bacteroidales bacterium]